ncbi:hypothetical protein AGMMS50212_09620 [Spirochaetia bacterium]|nr:hypothetical protein AGMMS50212_09620 [Spirochaetia bacterium]
MAGGSGTRLWPSSTSHHPKQFLNIPGDKKNTFFNAALDRAVSVIEPAKGGRIIIIAGKEHKWHIEKICSLYNSNIKKCMYFIIEPSAKNTAPALALACIFAEITANKSRNMVVLTSDHIIEPESVWTKQACVLSEYTKKEGLAVFGIKPVKAETGYGYIEADMSNKDDKGVLPVLSFREKPDSATAEKFIKSGNFFWNSGMFAFNTGFMLNEFKNNAGEVVLPFLKLQPPSKEDWDTAEGLNILKNMKGLQDAYNNTHNATGISEWTKTFLLSMLNTFALFSVPALISSCFAYSSQLPTSHQLYSDIIIITFLHFSAIA